MGEFLENGMTGSMLCYTLWKCNNRECGIIYGTVDDLKDEGPIKSVSDDGGFKIKRRLSESMIKVVARAVETYNLALKAEYSGLLELARMGFRKAIEYVIADYLDDRRPVLDDMLHGPSSLLVNPKAPPDMQRVDLRNTLGGILWLAGDQKGFWDSLDHFGIREFKELASLILDEIQLVEQLREIYLENQ